MIDWFAVGENVKNVKVGDRVALEVSSLGIERDNR